VDIWMRGDAEGGFEREPSDREGESEASRPAAMSIGQCFYNTLQHNTITQHDHNTIYIYPQYICTHTHTHTHTHTIHTRTHTHTYTHTHRCRYTYTFLLDVFIL
jgi:hypothetical protein